MSGWHITAPSDACREGMSVYTHALSVASTDNDARTHTPHTHAHTHLHPDKHRVRDRERERERGGFLTALSDLKKQLTYQHSHTTIVLLYKYILWFWVINNMGSR